MSALTDSPFDGNFKDISRAIQIQLAPYVIHVCFDRLSAQVEAFGHLPGPETLADKLEDLKLPVAERFNGRGRGTGK